MHSDLVTPRDDGEQETDQKSEHTPSHDSPAPQSLDESMPPTVSLSLEAGSAARTVTANCQSSQCQIEQESDQNAQNNNEEEPQQSKSYTYEEVSEPETENERAQSQTTGNPTLSFAVENFDPSTPSLLPTARPATLLANPGTSQLGVAAQSALDTQDFYASPPRNGNFQSPRNENAGKGEV